MSYKICVKQFRPNDQGLSLHHRHDLDTLNSTAQNCVKKMSDSINHQEAVKRYICKLLKIRRMNKNNERLVASQRNTALEGIAQISNSPKESSPPKNHQQSPIKKLYNDLFKSESPETSKLRYIISEPVPIVKQNKQYPAKNVNLDKPYFPKKIFDLHGYSAAESISSERRHLLRDLNLNKVLEKYHSKIAVEASKDRFESSSVNTPFEMSKQKNESWGTTMYKLKNKLLKAKKHKNYEMKINQIDTSTILMQSKEKRCSKKEGTPLPTKKVTKYELERLKVKHEKKGKSKHKEGDFNPWSTEDIRLSDTMENQR